MDDGNSENKISKIREVSEINLIDPKYKRAGIIPYCIQNGVIFFGFGIENGSAALADFGGHKNDTDIDLVDTAIREYGEEAFNIFGLFTREHLLKCGVLEGDDTFEILVGVQPPIGHYTETFYKILSVDDANINHEVQGIVWLSRRQLLNLLDNSNMEYKGVKIFQMYDRIHNTLNKYRHLL